MTNILPTDFTQAVYVEDDTPILWRQSAGAGFYLRPLIAVSYRGMTYNQIFRIADFLGDLGFEIYATSKVNQVYHYHHKEAKLERKARC